MEAMEKYIPLVVAIVGGLFGAWVIVKVTIAELKKDISHLKDKLNTEIANNASMSQQHTENMKEVRDDVKAIFRTLTKIQVDVAKGQGRDEVLTTVKDAMLTIANKTTG
jgi:ribosomal protein L29